MLFEKKMLVDCLSQEKTPGGVINYIRDIFQNQCKNVTIKQLSNKQIVNDIFLAIEFFGENKVIEDVVAKKDKNRDEIKSLLNMLYTFSE